MAELDFEDISLDPFVCVGCHAGDFPGFDHFCDVLNVRNNELPAAFAAWLGGTTSWDGEYGEVTDDG